jgi:hypothetical protein
MSIIQQQRVLTEENLQPQPVLTEEKTPQQTFLTEEEQNTLIELQNNTRSLIKELGEITLVKIQIENRYETAKDSLAEITLQEEEFSEILTEKYGNFSLNPETAEVIKRD